MTRRDWVGAAALVGLLAGCGGPEASPVQGSGDGPVAEVPAGTTAAQDTTYGLSDTTPSLPDDEARPRATPGRRMPMSGRMAGMHERMMGGESPEDAPDATAAPASAPGCPDVHQDLVERGKAVFAGAGGCSSCHGGDARGGQLGPDLTDDRWLNVDGAYASIAEVIRTGVSDPQQFPAPMPPMGGARLSQEQVCAAAAYIYSLSH